MLYSSEASELTNLEDVFSLRVIREGKNLGHEEEEIQ